MAGRTTPWPGRLCRDRQSASGPHGRSPQRNALVAGAERKARLLVELGEVDIQLIQAVDQVAAAEHIVEQLSIG